LAYIIDAYEPVVTGFHKWLSNGINEEHAEAIEELYDLEGRMNKVEREWRNAWDDPQLVQEETPHESGRVPLVESSSDASGGSISSNSKKVGEALRGRVRLLAHRGTDRSSERTSLGRRPGPRLFRG
jgi:hypothetical protein